MHGSLVVLIFTTQYDYQGFLLHLFNLHALFLGQTGMKDGNTEFKGGSDTSQIYQAELFRGYKSIIFGSLDARASDNKRIWKKMCAKLFHIHAIHDARVSRALEFGNSCVTLCLPCVRNLYTPCSSNQASRDARIWEKVCDKLFHIRTIHDP